MKQKFNGENVVISVNATVWVNRISTFKKGGVEHLQFSITAGRL